MTPARRTEAELVLVSFLALFLEMASVRWFNATVQIVAYFTNLVVISSFLGLGLGCLVARRRSLLAGAGPLLLLVAVAGVLGSAVGFQVTVAEDVTWTVTNASRNVLAIPAILAVFALNTVVFVPIGQALGRRFDAVREASGEQGALRAYALDIAGSLLGILAFALVSALRAPPIVWFAVAGALLWPLVESRAARTALVATVAAALAVVGLPPPSEEWSPYYCVRTHALADGAGFTIDVDGLRIQDALTFGPALDASPLAPWRAYYRLPYHFVKPRSVLVLGAGSGNDVVMALSQHVPRVVAVEIDPVIAGFGKTLHPHQPYKDPRVELVVDDARAYLARTSERFDLVVMSALDSHRQLAGMATLRLESYVYTVESFEAVRRVLEPGGMFVLNLGSNRPWVWKRAYASLGAAFGAPPRVLTTPNSPVNSSAYVSGGPAALDDHGPPEDGVHVRALPPLGEPTPLAVDDWPHLYLKDHLVPPAYLGVLAGILAAAGVLVFLLLPKESRRGVSAHFAFLGCGFMLLETRSLTAIALLVGSTWYVNAVVIGSILLVILAANALVQSGRAPGRRVTYALLALALVIGWLVPLDSLLGLGFAVRIAAGAIDAGAPVFFAALLFSRSFGRAKDVGAALGANLVGAVLGGALEFSSTVVGLRALYLLALLVYGLSALALVRERE
jgi:SAM-dependent methyltransferase